MRKKEVVKILKTVKDFMMQGGETDCYLCSNVAIACEEYHLDFEWRKKAKHILGILRPIAEELGAEPLKHPREAWCRPVDNRDFNDGGTSWAQYREWKIEIINTAIERL